MRGKHCTGRGNPVMISASSAIYAVLLEKTRDYQMSLMPDHDLAPQLNWRMAMMFTGAALCKMLHLHYKQIRDCSDVQRDKLSQEVSILQAIVER